MIVQREMLEKIQEFSIDNFPRIADIINKVKTQREISENSRKFGWQFPLASFFVFIVALSVPDVIYSVSLGVPFIKVAMSFDKFSLALIIWSLVFHSKSDIFYRFFNTPITKTIIGVLCEINRKRTYARLTLHSLKLMGNSIFAALIIPTFYCIGFLLAIYPMDQLIRGKLVEEHEAKHPHFPTIVVLMYSVTSGLFLYCRDIEALKFLNLQNLSLDIIFESVMIVAIIMTIFKNLIGCDALCKIKERIQHRSKHKMETVKTRKLKVEFSGSSEDAKNESPKTEDTQMQLRKTRKRQPAKL